MPREQVAHLAVAEARGARTGVVLRAQPHTGAACAGSGGHALFERLGRDRLAAEDHSATTVLWRMPMRSISSSTSSPGCARGGGGGQPRAITSPRRSVVCIETALTTSLGAKRSARVFDLTRVSPFTRHSTPRPVETSFSEIEVSIQGPIEANVSLHFARK